MLVGFGLDEHLREPVEVHCYYTTGFLVTLRRAPSPALDALRQAAVAGVAVKLSGNNSLRCSARNANTVTGGTRCPAIISASSSSRSIRDLPSMRRSPQIIEHTADRNAEPVTGYSDTSRASPATAGRRSIRPKPRRGRHRLSTPSKQRSRLCGKLGAYKVRIAATEDGRSSVYGWEVDGCMVTRRRGHGPLAVKRRGGDLYAMFG